MTFSYFFSFSFSFLRSEMNLSSLSDFYIKICLFFSKSFFNYFISFSKITFLEFSDFTFPCKSSFSFFKASTCTFKFYNYFLLFSASIAEVLVELICAVLFVTWVNPLIWETFTPLFCNLSSSYLTLAFNFSIFCCLPFHPFSSLSTWSTLKFYPNYLAITLMALLS